MIAYFSRDAPREIGRNSGQARPTPSRSAEAGRLPVQILLRQQGPVAGTGVFAARLNGHFFDNLGSDADRFVLVDGKIIAIEFREEQNRSNGNRDQRNPQEDLENGERFMTFIKQERHGENDQADHVQNDEKGDRSGTHPAAENNQGIDRNENDRDQEAGPEREYLFEPDSRSVGIAGGFRRFRLLFLFDFRRLLFFDLGLFFFLDLGRFFFFSLLFLPFSTHFAFVNLSDGQNGFRFGEFRRILIVQSRGKTVGFGGLRLPDQIGEIR